MRQDEQNENVYQKNITDIAYMALILFFNSKQLLSPLQ